jgi:hypothetical protein
LTCTVTGSRSNFFAPSAGRTAGLKAGRLAGLWGKKTGAVAFSCRIASRALVIVANGPSVFASFGAGSLPDHASFPFVAT